MKNTSFFSINRVALVFIIVIFPNCLAVFAHGADSGNLSLPDAIRLGLERNPRFRTVVESLELADLDLAEARAEFATRFTASVSSDARLGTELGQTYDLTARKRFLAGPSVALTASSSTYGDTTLSEVSAQVSQPLLKGRGEGPVRLREAELASKRRLRLKTVAEEELIFQIITAYYQVVRQQQVIEVQEKTRQRMEKLLATARAKLSAGLVSKMDVFRAEIQASQSEDRLQEAGGGLEQAGDELRMLLGLDFDAGLTVKPDVSYERTEPELEQQRELALANRPELAELRDETGLARQRLELARRNRLPPLDLTLSVSQVGQGEDFSDSTDLEETRVGVGVSTSTDFFRRTADAEFRRAYIHYRNKQRELHQKKVSIINEVRQGVREVERGYARIGLRNAREMDAETQVEYALLRYEKGLIDNLAVIDAEQELVEARTGRISAVIDYLVAVNRLHKICGRLGEVWEVRLAGKSGVVSAR